MDRIRNQIDQALQQDDAHRRRREMQFLLLPTRFPSPESMGQDDITVWTNWIHEETEVVMNQLEEELEARNDPDDPFNGSAKGVYQPFQENFSLPPPVQTPRRQENVSKHRESLGKSLRNEQKTKTTSINMKQVETKTSTQAASHKSSEHSLESLDLMRSIRNLHIQELQNCTCNETANHNRVPRGPNNEVNTSPQDHNLITFTPPPGQYEVQQGTTGRQGEPKKQRPPKRTKQEVNGN